MSDPPPDFANLSEAELKLIHALQINPRVSWTSAGAALAVDPSTASRTWQGLSASGRAWVSASPRSAASEAPLIAFIEMSCRIGTADTVAADLADQPWAATIERTTGSRDLLVSGMVTDLSALAALVSNELEAIDGVEGTRVQVATFVAAEGAGWRLHALSAEAIRKLSDQRPAVQARPVRVDHHDTALLRELGRDGRMGYSEIASRTGLGISTIRRRVQRLIATSTVSLRCEVAQPLSGWPVSAALWCRVPPARLGQVMSGFSGMPEIRLCASVTGGPANLLLALWLRSPADLQRLEALVGERLPDLDVMDRALTLRHVKRMGRILDSRGRAVGVVPVVPRTPSHLVEATDVAEAAMLTFE
ncbi:Lrp/AsnC family transcriptional regulator [Amycolatopsis silviterrae]|uniref:Lrp/AsnC family transcriptional regulator n=1 Tax=Amycolatopsis silviterrae TaxID=1656914 RepID=A0ABW5HK98_9PSEU